MLTNIALIGFMAAGKSSVGRALAKKLHMGFIETDSMIEERAGRSVSAIFRIDGEAAFRLMESSIAEEVSQLHRTVISCGGGIVLNPANIENLRNNATIIYLKADPDIILQRVQRSAEIRPLLAVNDPAAEIRRLLSQREPLYANAADITIDTTSQDIRGVVNAIMTELGKDAGINLKKQCSG